MTTFETRRFVPEVSVEAAAVLGRPAEAHTVVEIWETITVFPDPTGFLAHRGPIKQKRRIETRREEFRPLTGNTPSLILG